LENEQAAVGLGGKEVLASACAGERARIAFESAIGGQQENGRNANRVG
jgi:hypothetical protein